MAITPKVTVAWCRECRVYLYDEIGIRCRCAQNTETKTATDILVESGILDMWCPACNGKTLTHNPEDKYQPCFECNGTGYRFHQFRLNCAKEHWAGNLPADCHPNGFALPAELEIPGILMGLPSFRYSWLLAGGNYVASFRQDKQCCSSKTIYAMADGRDLVIAMVSAFVQIQGKNL